MAVSCQVVTFTKETGGAAGATQDVSLSFTPKAIIVYSVGSETTVAEDHYITSIGFSDGTNNCCVAARSDDADGSSDTNSIVRNNACVSIWQGTALSELVIGSATFIANGVRFTWATNDRNAYYIHLIAYGGDDITNVKVASQLSGTTTGSSPYTVDYTGLGFNPSDGDSVVFIGGAAKTTFNTSGSVASPFFGCAATSSKQWALYNLIESASDPSDTWRYHSNSKILLFPNSTDGTLYRSAAFSSWITNGFRLEYNSTLTDGYAIFYLVIKGGTWDIGSETTRTTYGTKTTTVAVNSNTLRGIITASTGAAAAELDTPTAEARIGFGTADGTAQSFIAAIDEDAQATMDSYKSNSSSLCVAVRTVNAASLFSCQFTSFGTNQFTITTATADASERYFGWVVVADGTTGPQLKYGTINETPSVSVSETLARIQSLTKTISDTPSVSVGVGTVTGARMFPRTISDTPTITVSETLARIKTLIRSISDTPTVTVGAETLARIKTLIRSISDTPTISISETLERLRTSPRPISETPSISVSEALVKYQIYPRPISTEPQVSIPIETIARLRTSPISISDTPTISVSEQLERIQLLIRLVTNEPEVSIGAETLTGYQLLSGSISEPLIKWYYSLYTKKIRAV